MLFSVSDANLKTVANGGSVGQDPDGTDILFTDSSGTLKVQSRAGEAIIPPPGQVQGLEVQVPFDFPHRRYRHLHLLWQRLGGRSAETQGRNVGQQLRRRLAASS